MLEMDIKECDQKAREVQKKVFALQCPGRKLNSYRPPKKTQSVALDGGVCYVNDIEYGKMYPNSFLDIWYADKNKFPNAPTFVYVHGGGNIFGDKAEGDPLAETSSCGYYKDLAYKGYNVVCVNYCFASKYRAPIQIRQLNEAFEFLLQHCADLRLNMTQICLGGSSAGANDTALYGLAVCERAYAAKLGFKPAISKKELKALVVDEFCLTPRFVTSNPNLTILYAVWLGSTNYTGRKAQMLDVADQIKNDYIPTFITASNVESAFYGCAKALDDKLENIGIAHEMYYRTAEEGGQLPHGFMANFAANTFAAECYEKMHAFLRRFI